MASKRTKPDKSANLTGVPMAGLLSSPVKTGLVVLLIAFAVYANTLGHGFVWDDRDLVLENPRVRVLNGETVRGMFTSNFWEGTQQGGYYRPLVTLSYHAQWKVYNGNPSGFHFANVMWNAVACALAFALVYLLLRNILAALATALFFALFPLHTENVAWVAGRTDVLSTLWALAALVLYVQGRQRGNIWLTVLALPAFFVALLAKESAAFVPAIVLVMELPPVRALLCRDGPGPGRAAVVAGVAGHFAVLFLYMTIRTNIIGDGAAPYDPYAEGILRWVGLPLSILWGYASKLVFPFRMNAEWDAAVPDSLAHPDVLLGLLVLAVIVVAVWRYRRMPEVMLGAAFFLLGLTPVLNVVPLGEVSAERFLYFPSLGAAIVLGAVAARALHAITPLLGKLRTMSGVGRASMSVKTAKPLAWILGIVLVAWGVTTVVRNPVWKSEGVLFAATAKAAPDSPRAHLNVGNVARREGRIDDAIAAYQRAIEVDPAYPDALSNLAGLYVQRGDTDAAYQLLQRAVRDVPNNAVLLGNLGMLHFQRREYAQAESYLQSSLRLSPNQPNAHFNMGLIRVQARDLPGARLHFEKVAAAGGRFQIALYYLAMIESSEGNRARARDYAQRFLAGYNKDDEIRERARAIAGQ